MSEAMDREWARIMTVEMESVLKDADAAMKQLESDIGRMRKVTQAMENVAEEGMANIRRATAHVDKAMEAAMSSTGTAKETEERIAEAAVSDALSGQYTVRTVAEAMRKAVDNVVRMKGPWLP